jgi:outer membrane protein OmpA-like peptidoglycan-associated protein
MIPLIRMAVLLPAVFVAASGCAAKDWVRGLTGKKEVEINQRVDKKDGQINQSVDELFVHVRDPGESVKTVRERADSAMNKAEGVDSRLTHLWNNRYKRKPVATIEVYFAFDKAALSQGAQTALLGVVKELEASPTLLVRLGGFTDLTGMRDYNYGLAQRRVEAVRRFLVEKGVELSRVQAIGMGPLDDRRIPEDKKRRVTVTLMADSSSRPGTRREVGE